MSAFCFWFIAAFAIGFGAGVIFAAWYLGREGKDDEE